METSKPFSPVWGKVTHVKSDPKNKGFILVTIAGQVLRLERSAGDGMQAIGLTRLTKKNKKVFLIYWEGRIGIHHVCAGWNNPDDVVARRLLAIISDPGEEFGDDFYKKISEYFPTWKSWNDSGDEFVDINEYAL